MGHKRSRAWGGKARATEPGGDPPAKKKRRPKSGRYAPASAFPRPPKGMCRFCRRPVGKGRRSFCSEACVDRYMALRSPAGLRRAVWERDKGVCRGCRLDCTAVEATVGGWMRSRAAGVMAAGLAARLGLGLDVLTPDGRQKLARRTLWDADHVVPVSAGGGWKAGLANVQTLCTVCHRNKNAAEMDRKAGRRPAERVTGAQQVSAVMGPLRAAVAALAAGGGGCEAGGPGTGGG